MLSFFKSSHLRERQPATCLVIFYFFLVLKAMEIGNNQGKLIFTSEEQDFSNNAFLETYKCTILNGP